MNDCRTKQKLSKTWNNALVVFNLIMFLCIVLFCFNKIHQQFL